MSEARPRTRQGVLGAMASALGADPRRILDAIALGVVGALGARVFVVLLDWASAFFLGWWAGYRAPGLPSEGDASACWRSGCRRCSAAATAGSSRRSAARSRSACS